MQLQFNTCQCGCGGFPKLFKRFISGHNLRGRTYPTLTERFWARVDSTGECWLWTGTRDLNNYGALHYRLPNQRVNKGAHRLSWEIHFGPIPDGLCVLHHCDNPPCVNPTHLFLGTKQVNSTDMKQKGRAKGTGPKLQSGQVRAIRQQYTLGHLTILQLAHQYNVHQNSIRDILSQRSYAHLCLMTIASESL